MHMTIGTLIVCAVAFCQLRFYHFRSVGRMAIDAYNPAHLKIQRETDDGQHKPELKYNEKLSELEDKVRYELFIFYSKVYCLSLRV